MRVILVEPDPHWAEQAALEASRIRTLLGSAVLELDHVGSTSVPGLPAKPIFDLQLVVADSADEAAYAPPLLAAGYPLVLREPHWHEHRMFNGPGAALNLHVFSAGCPEVARVLRFRDRLRAHPQDRALYAQTKAALSQQEWPDLDAYAAAKTAVIEAILARQP
jgi:GrpB-like predicted nucleotidyltransferase (UPF0157 family)